MQLTIDPHNPTTAYADLRDDESLTDELRERASARAHELGAENVEFWRTPYGRGADRMAGFVELAYVPETDSSAGELVAPPGAQLEEGRNYVPR